MRWFWHSIAVAGLAASQSSCAFVDDLAVEHSEYDRKRLGSNTHPRPQIAWLRYTSLLRIHRQPVWRSAKSPPGRPRQRRYAERRR